MGYVKCSVTGWHAILGNEQNVLGQVGSVTGLGA